VDPCAVLPSRKNTQLIYVVSGQTGSSGISGNIAVRLKRKFWQHGSLVAVSARRIDILSHSCSNPTVVADTFWSVFCSFALQFARCEPGHPITRPHCAIHSRGWTYVVDPLLCTCRLCKGNGLTHRRKRNVRACK
jgi:hypothetical protein